jgi:hypothetical protein
MVVLSLMCWSGGWHDAVRPCRCGGLAVEYCRSDPELLLELLSERRSPVSPARDCWGI